MCPLEPQLQLLDLGTRPGVADLGIRRINSEYSTIEILILLTFFPLCIRGLSYSGFSPAPGVDQAGTGTWPAAGGRDSSAGPATAAPPPVSASLNR